jgi:hypothetical protein
MKVPCFCFFAQVALVLFLNNYLVNGVQSAELVQVWEKIRYPSDYLSAMLVCSVVIDSLPRFCLRTIEEKSMFLINISQNDYMFSAEILKRGRNKSWITSFNLNCGSPCREIHGLKGTTVREICLCNWYRNLRDLIFPSQN